MSTMKNKDELEKLARDIIDTNYDDWTKGADYTSLAKRYSEQGKQAMDDTIGKVAARTGGLASSYATAAGGQAYADYMTQLEDTARSLYDSQRSEAFDRLSVAQDMYDRQQSKQQNDQLLAQDEIQMLLAGGKKPSNDLIAQSGKTSEYWDAYKNAINSTGGQKLSLKEEKDWSEAFDEADEYSIERLFNKLAAIDEDYAFVLLTKWANESDGNKAFVEATFGIKID